MILQLSCDRVLLSSGEIFNFVITPTAELTLNAHEKTAAIEVKEAVFSND